MDLHPIDNTISCRILSTQLRQSKPPTEWIQSIGEFRMPPQADRHLQQLMDRNTEGLLQPSEKEKLAALSEELSLLSARALEILGQTPG